MLLLFKVQVHMRVNTTSARIIGRYFYVQLEWTSIVVVKEAFVSAMKKDEVIIGLKYATVNKFYISSPVSSEDKRTYGNEFCILSTS